MIVNNTDELELERLPLSLRFNTQTVFRKELIKQKQRKLNIATDDYIKAKHYHSHWGYQFSRAQLLEAIKQADRALWR